VVARLGRTIQGHKGYLRQFLLVEMMQGERLPRALNGRYLKKYYPSVWQDT
jgi:hypothetical protein